jgi:zinc resistance-associated protein
MKVHEETTMKTLATLAAVSVLSLAGAAIAQTTPAQPSSPAPQAQDQANQPQRDTQRRPRLSQADLEALTDARMAAIQAGLKLNPQQQQLWTPVEQAFRSMATQRAERFEERRQRMEDRRGPQDAQQPSRDLSQDLEQRAQRMTQSAQRLTALSEAMKPFYASLSEDQKRLLPVLIRQGRGDGHHGRMGMRDRDGHHGRMGGTMGHGSGRL